MQGARVGAGVGRVGRRAGGKETTVMHVQEGHCKKEKRGYKTTREDER